MDLMTEVLPQNQENLWIFSVLTVFFDWIFLLSGVQRILNMLVSSSYVGILSPLWKNGSTRYDAARQPEFQESGLLRELSANIEATVSDPDELASYKLAINHLIYQLGLALSPGSQNLDIVDAFVWHFVAPESFMLLLKQKRQAAIVIFVHSLIVFHALNSNHWLHGWDILLLSRAWTMLDDEHRLWIQWPIEEIGWAPPPDNIS
ncbi:hypothetical protein K4F52_008034 [Lecanicillium sp. MT-2017a]|nr:hypothetical protein K4F52_008034 [Lecanicillium sp. MT-2017a]